MTNKSNGNGNKLDDLSSKTIPLPPSPKNQVVKSYHRPTFDSILNEYPELTQFFELKQVNADDNMSKNTSNEKKSGSNGKFSLNKIFNFSSNKSEQKSSFGFSFGKNKNKNYNSKPQNPPPSTSTVRESLQRAALSLTNSLEINDIIEKQLQREYITIYAKIKNIPHFYLNYNKPDDKRSRKKNQKLNTNALTYSYMIKILTYLKYQENLKICKAQHNHCERHKKYIQNLLEIVNIVNKEFTNYDLIINGKLLNYSIMNDEKLLQAAAASTPPSTSPSNSPLDKFRKTEIGSTVKYLREKTAKHEKRRKLLIYKINELIAKENSSRSTVINELLNKLFNIDYDSATIKINSAVNTNSITNKNYPVKRRNKQGRNRKTSPSATKSYSSSNLAQLSKGKIDINNTSSNLSNLTDKKEGLPFDNLNENGNDDNDNIKNPKISRNNSNPVVTKSSSSSLLQANNQKHSSDEEYISAVENFNKNDNDNDNNYNKTDESNKNDTDNRNDNDNIINDADSTSPIKDTISIHSFEDESDPLFNSAASSLASSINIADYEEVIHELRINGSLDIITPPVKARHSDVSDDQILHHNRGRYESSDDIILSDSESIQNKNKRADVDYEYSEYSDNDSYRLSNVDEVDEDDENLAELQIADENDILFEETLRYIEDKEGLFLDFELLIEKASETTAFKSNLISNTIKKIKKSPKDSGVLTLKLCQIFEDEFLKFDAQKEKQIKQQIKMEQDAIMAAQKNNIIQPNLGGLIPYTVQPYVKVSPNTSSSELSTKTEEKPKNVMRFLFIMFSKLIFNEIYVTTFHQEFYYVQDFLFSNSILNALDQIPSVSNELKPSLPYLPVDVQNLKLMDLTHHESFRVYSSCIEDVMMLQFKSSLVDFCYAAFKILEKIQKIASEILYDKKIEEELEKIRDEASTTLASSYNHSNINNINFSSSDNFQDKCKSLENQSPMSSATSDNERGNSNSLPKATYNFSLVDNDDESSNRESNNNSSNNNIKLISSSASNSSVSLQRESMYSTRKSKMQLKADCQLSCDQLLDITTIIVILAGPFDLRRMIDLFGPFFSGLRLSSQLEFAFITLQSVCSHILESFNPANQMKARSKKNMQKKNEESRKDEEAGKDKELRKDDNQEEIQNQKENSNNEN